MSDVVRFEDVGSADQLQLVKIEVGEPGEGEVRIEQHAVGVNPLDISQRRGEVKIPLPSGIGLEGAGVVAAVGPNVSNVKVGDRVAYATGPIGSYAASRLYPAERLVKLPDSVSFEEAAAVLFKGITAQYLLKTTYPVGRGTYVLLYGAAGGVGQLMASWARHLGAVVIGVVSKESSVERARAAGCEHVFVYDSATLAANVLEATGGRKADVVYDPIGKLTFDTSLDCLKVRGLMVSFGISSGVPDPVAIGTLNAKGSLYLTRPSLAAHVATADAYQERAADVLDALVKGIIKAHVATTYALKDAAKAQQDLENGHSRGAIVLVP
ncbi:quinone oxidoreductase [Pseudomonas sp. REP124]|uniref:quinone oxidoreductase family protein n=1 Tax=Pseudomonas sp. REP124 TaxID=2875731 RepID=UPI001CCECF8F|nr:quinone oxidoreductase [Pseudomonas sp. REP124]MBZ9780372.1 quinone oxidoreductase [Pseudomonas sp. REP124]